MNNKDITTLESYLHKVYSTPDVHDIDYEVDEEKIIIYGKDTGVYINTQFYTIGDHDNRSPLYLYHIYLAVRMANKFNNIGQDTHPDAFKMMSFYNQISCFYQPLNHNLTSGDYGLYIEVWPELKVYIKCEYKRFQYIMITFDKNIYIDFTNSLSSKCSMIDAIDTETFAEFFIKKMSNILKY